MLTGSIFIDLSKPFDTLSHAQILEKPVINWSQMSRVQTFPELPF